MIKKTELRIEWERRIEVFRASGQTQTKWCEVNDLSLHQFKHWLKKIEQTTPKPKSKTNWVPVNMNSDSQACKESLMIKIGETSIEVKPGFNPSFLAEVVRTLKSLC